MSELSFAELFEGTESNEAKQGEVVKGTVVKVESDVVWVDAGLKSEAQIPVEQFKNNQGEIEVSVGDNVDVVVESIEDGFGTTLLSREKAKRFESWSKLEQAYSEQALVTGLVDGKVKGGFTVSVDGIRAFLPGSLVDVRPVRDREADGLLNQTLEFKVIKLDQKRNNVVVSRRAVIEVDDSASRSEVLANLEEGMEVEGTVKNLTEYGAFVDLGGGVDGLLHITDMAWKRVKHPSEIVNQGDKIKVKVLKFDQERSRVSLGLKQLGSDPWVDIATRYPKDSEIEGTVTNLMDYGCFIEIEEGVEGLVHVSEMDWTNKNLQPAKVVSLGEKVKVKVLDINEANRRISLGLKQCKPNPWKLFNDTHSKGDKVTGKVKSVTDFGIFIGLEGGIDGLVHSTDLCHNADECEAQLLKYKSLKNVEVTAVVLTVDPERERISLGIKQLEEDTLSKFTDNNKKNSIVKGIVKSIDAKGIVVDLGDDVEGFISPANASQNRVDDITTLFNVGDEVEAKYTGTDHRKHQVTLSIRAKFEAEEKAAIDAINQSNQEIENSSSAMMEAFNKAK